MNRGIFACLAVAAIAASGCSNMTRKDCAIVGGLLGGTIGGVGGAAAVHNLDATPNDWERGAGAGGGAVAGILLGSLLGYSVCEDPAPEPMAAPPPPPPPPASGTRIVEIRDTHFAFDSAKLTGSGEAILDSAVDVLNEHAGVTVRCEGHTDSIGSEAYNMQLGMRRAESVCDYLAQNGISRSRLSTKSYGESMPVASNDTESGRAENRRVEVVVD